MLEGVDLLKDAVLVHLEVVLPEVEDRAAVGRRVDVHAHEVGGRPELRRRLAGCRRRLLCRESGLAHQAHVRPAFGQGGRNRGHSGGNHGRSRQAMQRQSTPSISHVCLRWQLPGAGGHKLELAPRRRNGDCTRPSGATATGCGRGSVPQKNVR